jgi:pimeloyl-ACP methyl ester carboxylesterase
MSSLDFSRNSTTVRSLFSGLQAFSPGLAAELAAVAMFRTSRKNPSEWEAGVSAGAERLSVDGPHGPLHVLRWGKGPLVVLVHGWNGRGSQLGAFVEPLVRAGLQVVAFDAPGHGGSAGSTSSLLEFADAFDAVVDAMKPFFQPLAAVVAHSMGGAAVTYALSRAAAKPGIGVEPGARSPRLVFIAPPIDMRDFVTTVSAELGLSERAQSALEQVVERRVGLRMADLHALRLAPAMKAPLLVLHDEQDRAIPIECSESLARAWPGAELQKTRGLGHNRILRDPQTIEAVVAYVKGVRPRESEKTP